MWTSTFKQFIYLLYLLFCLIFELRPRAHIWGGCAPSEVRKNVFLTVNSHIAWGAHTNSLCPIMLYKKGCTSHLNGTPLVMLIYLSIFVLLLSFFLFPFFPSFSFLPFLAPFLIVILGAGTHLNFLRFSFIEYKAASLSSGIVVIIQKRLWAYKSTRLPQVPQCR